METVEVQLFSNRVNMPVMKHPGRHYPGVLIQGDSLAILYSMADQLYQLTNDPQQKQEADSLVGVLASYVKVYEAALAEHGINLPYSPSMTASAKDR